MWMRKPLQPSLKKLKSCPEQQFSFPPLSHPNNHGTRTQAPVRDTATGACFSLEVRRTRASHSRQACVGRDGSRRDLQSGGSALLLLLARALPHASVSDFAIGVDRRTESAVPERALWIHRARDAG